MNLGYHSTSNTNSTKVIPNRVDIDQRPQVANDRLRVGDREADTVIGANHKVSSFTTLWLHLMKGFLN